MNKLFGAALLAAVAAAGAASAQEFKGAELSAEILMFDEGDDLTSMNYRGSLEFGVFGPFGGAADLSFYDFEDDDSARSVTLHAIYDAFSMATVGAFYARDSADGQDADLYGIEASSSFGSFGGEVYLGMGSDEVDDIVTFGFDGAYDVTSSISVLASGAAVDLESGGFSRLSVGGEYRFGETGPALYAEIGRLGVGIDDGDSASNTFIGLGGRIAIGPNRGTTFESRGIFELLGSF